jgi:hypothetical protein
MRRHYFFHGLLIGVVLGAISWHFVENWWWVHRGVPPTEVPARLTDEAKDEARRVKVTPPKVEIMDHPAAQPATSPGSQDAPK